MINYEELAKQFMKNDDKERKEIFFAFVENATDMVTLDCETLEKIIPIISIPDKQNNCYCIIFGIRYELEYIYKYFTEEYIIEIDNYYENDYTIIAKIYQREDEIEYEDFELFSVLFVKEFWDFYLDYINS